MAFVINWPVPESDSEEDKAIAAKALEFNVSFK